MIIQTTRNITRTAAIAAALLALTTLSACSSGGSLAVRGSLNQQAVLAGNFTTGVYAYHDPNTLDIVLADGEPESASQIVHIRMHWRPVAGATPVDQRSTNATVHYLVFAPQATGVYTGAGFLFPRARPGKPTFNGELRSTALRLADASENFDDRLGLAEATGGFSVTLDQSATLQILKTAQSRLHQQLGYPRFVLDETNITIQPTLAAR